METLFYHSPNVLNKSARARKKGRVTISVIIEEDGTAKFGAAKCSPKDNFSRKIGRHMSLNRASNSETAIAVVEIPHDVPVIRWFKDMAIIMADELLNGKIHVNRNMFNDGKVD